MLFFYFKSFIMKVINVFTLLILISVGAFAQGLNSPTRNVYLKIIDKKGRPVSNIVIQSLNTGMTGITDRSGLFVFGNMSDNDIISMMLPKYGETTVSAAGMDSIVVTLRSASRYSYVNDEGKSVIINKNKTASGSILDVPELLKQGNYKSLGELLSGRVAGLNVTQAGSATIRGTNSFMLSSEPLVVLDGLPVGTLSDAERMVNLYDIKTIEIQKSATEWGARGANGAILIKTK